MKIEINNWKMTPNDWKFIAVLFIISQIFINIGNVEPFYLGLVWIGIAIGILYQTYSINHQIKNINKNQK